MTIAKGGTGLAAGYLGNTNLKRPGIAINWTESQFQEYLRCKQNSEYFVENYMRIVSLDKGLVKFKMYPYQKKMLYTFYKKRYTICKLPRQSGKSTTYCAFILHYIIFNDYKSVALLANKAEIARSILERVQLAYEHLPKWLQHGVVEYNKSSLKLENGSEVFASATSSASIRGMSANIVILDEVAAIEHWDEFYTATYPVISSGEDTKIIMVSTPKGLNHFYKFWKDAEEGRNGFVPISIHWSETPGRTEKFKKDTIAATSEQQWEQEFETEFLGSSGTLISGKKLKELAFSRPIAFNKEFDIRYYRNPDPDHKYVITVDVSRGAGIDCSAFSVIDITQTPFRVVAVMNNPLLFSHELAEIVFNAAKLYNRAYIIVENNDIGAEVGNVLNNDYGYENLLFSQKNGRAGLELTFNSAGTTVGIKTTSRTKRVGCSALKNLIEGNQLIIDDNASIMELCNFIKKKDSYVADEGFHDDIVMTLVIFAYLVDQTIFKDLADENYRRPNQFAESDYGLPEIVITGGDEYDPYDEFKQGVWQRVGIDDSILWG